MELLKTKQHIGGGYRYFVKLSNDEIVSFYSNSTLTTAQLNEKETEYLIEHEYDSVEQEIINILEHRDILVQFVTLIKANPTVTFNQYNNWLNSKSWQIKAVLSYFIYALADKMAKRLGVDLENPSEEQVFIYLRDKLVESPARKIEKFIFGE